MKKIIRPLVIALFFSGIMQSCSHAQVPEKGDYLIAFYNVENLFDTINDPDKRDDDFTPQGRKKWTSKRYNKKIHDIAKVIHALGDDQKADIVGLAEVENRAVLEALIQHPLLKEHEFSIIHFESPDERGIDVALLYRNARIKKITAENIFVRYPWDIDDRTRDILYAKLSINNQPIHVFVNHWSSRGGGRAQSEPKRVEAARILRAKIDSLKKTEPAAAIIVMGDMNDEPNNISVKRVLYANGKQNENTNSLYNMSWDSFNKGKGSYHYWKTNEWNMLDQIMVSRSLLNEDNSPLHVSDPNQGIFKPGWLLYKNEDGSLTPSKTYGRHYYGGYSDHLPVYFYIND
ncbi:MAG: endonuclease/exonuclease/phosphatase family protein [Bacteroidales bacterium]